jgi:hypothetical protein
MAKRVNPSQEQIARAIRAALGAGLCIRSINSMDGTLIVKSCKSLGSAAAPDADDKSKWADDPGQGDE